ncbi:hypothetical protein OSTOST_24696 [Ostertagia ostertagi]
MNRLKTLPSSIVKVRHLQTLVLSFNELSSLPRDWTASPMISSCFIYERIDFAIETDRLHMVTMHCLACQKCVVRVGQEIVRNLL